MWFFSRSHCANCVCNVFLWHDAFTPDSLPVWIIPPGSFPNPRLGLYSQSVSYSSIVQIQSSSNVPVRSIRRLISFGVTSFCFVIFCAASLYSQFNCRESALMWLFRSCGGATYMTLWAESAWILTYALHDFDRLNWHWIWRLCLIFIFCQ